VSSRGVPVHRLSRKRAFTILEILMALAIFAIGMVSVLALFPIAIYAQRRMIDNTRSSIVAREAIHILRANRVASYLSTLGIADAAWVAVQYPGNNVGGGGSLFELVSGAYTPVVLDIDGYYGVDSPRGWEYVWTTWNEDVAPGHPRPDAWPNIGVPERPFSNYGWTANIYQQEQIPTAGTAQAYRYRVQIAVFRGYDGTPVTLTAATTVADNDPANHNKGYIEAVATELADVLTRDRGYVRIGLPLDPMNQLWYRVESVRRRVGPGRDRTRIVLAEPLRGAVPVPGGVTAIGVSEDLVYTLDTVITARP